MFDLGYRLSVLIIEHNSELLMDFTTPLALLLLLLIPYFIWLGRPSLRSGLWREWFSLGLRLVIMLLLVLGLAGTRIVRAADELAVVFLMDASDSISPGEFDRVVDYVRQAIDTMGPEDQAAVVLFGANALVDRPMSRLAELAPIRSIPLALHSDIAEALRLGLALFPSGTARRIILLSDGSETIGNALEAAQIASDAGIQIDILPLDQAAGKVEVSITNIDAPSRVREGEQFSVHITAESNVNTSAKIRVLSGDNLIFDREISLISGVNNFVVPLRAAAQEFSRYVVQLTPQDDTYFQNNQLAAFTQIIGPPKVLLVAQKESVDDAGVRIIDESQFIQLALEETGILLDRVTPSELSSNLAELASYDSIILVNLNAKEISTRKMAALEIYVRDLGGGLVASGGPQSFGMGGYFRTPLESLLPVDMQIKDQERFPSVSLVLVLDRSGSMGMQEGGLTKIQLAAEGAVRVVELLNDFDEITIIPVDTAPDMVIGPAKAANREEIVGQIRGIGSGGGGIYVRTGLEAAAQALAETENEIKHIIVLADGSDSEQKEGVPELIDALVSEGVTISMVSIGGGPDVPWLQEMAALGGGRFHFTDRAANIPQIFTQETTAIQRSYLIEERFFPNLGRSAFASRHAIFQAMESANITLVPPLFGYVGTSPKDSAQVILETHLGDPLLAAWDYGLGRSVAFTSDASGRWARSWVSWDGFPTFWSNLVRWTISEGRESILETLVSFEGDQAQLTVDALNPDGTYINDLELEANVIFPSGEISQVQFHQTSPGRYTSHFIPDTEGAYLIHIAGSAEARDSAIGQTLGWVLGYSPEYRQLEPNVFLLGQIADITGGRLFAASPSEWVPESAFAHDLPVQTASRPIWPLLLLLAVVLLPIDIASRRLVVTRGDLNQLWTATFGRLGSPRAARPVRAQEVARLFEAKSRAQTGVQAQSKELGGEQKPGSAIIESHALDKSKGETGLEKRGEAGPLPDTTGQEDDGTLASRLLARKRGSSPDQDEPS